MHRGARIFDSETIFGIESVTIAGTSLRMTTTIVDIARFAKVSVGTVSKVLNNKGYVSSELRTRVQDAIDRLNYRPSVSARNMRRNRTDMVGLIVPQVQNSFYVQIINSIESVAGERNMTLVLTNTGEQFEAEIRALRAFSSLRVAGLLLATTGRLHERALLKELDTFHDLQIPVTLIVRSLSSEIHDTVVLDNVGGARIATNHLLEHGHSRIGIISSAPNTSSSLERIEGYKTALKAAGVGVDPSLIKVGESSRDSGRSAVHELLALSPRPTALFVASNVQLIGAIRALKEMRLGIPDEISVICFDDTEWISLVQPPLTSVVPSADELARRATDLLFRRMDGQMDIPATREIVPTRLVVRESVSPPRV
ncbi:MAG: LacI family DNA-binding transcriptional regulator [Spirochaetota bacterium]